MKSTLLAALGTSVLLLNAACVSPARASAPAESSLQLTALTDPSTPRIAPAEAPRRAPASSPSVSLIEPEPLSLQDRNSEARLWRAGANYRGFAESDLDDTDAELSVDRFGFYVSRAVPLDEKRSLQFTFDQEFSDYDFDGGVLGLADPFDDVSKSEISAVYRSQESEKWGWFAALTLAVGVDDDADYDDGIYSKFGGAFLYALSETLSIGLGVFVRTELEDDASGFALPLIEWEFSERGRLGVVRSSDPGLGVTYDWTEELDAYVAASFDQRQYRIDDSAALSDAAFVDEETNLRVGAIYRNEKGFTAEAFTGVGFRTLTIDVDDSELGDDDVDPALTFGVAIGYAF